MRVLGIDPGGTTGAAVVVAPGIVARPADLVYAQEFEFEAFLDALHEIIGLAELVAVERYTIGPRTIKFSRQPQALYAIGAIMAECRKSRVEMVLQNPADAKSAFSDGTLKLFGMHSPSPHVRDATRHALLACRRGGVDVHTGV